MSIEEGVVSGGSPGTRNQHQVTSWRVILKGGALLRGECRVVEDASWRLGKDAHGLQVR